MSIETYTEFCTGCGLCHSVCNVQFSSDSKGYPVPNLISENIDFCSRFCPASGVASRRMDRNCVWGRYVSVHAGWASHKEIRNEASSGGVLTAICCYLLEEKIVDGIIQIKASDTVVYETETVISRNSQEVKSCSGSRYAISSPLYDLKAVIHEGEKYAVVGKPCDVSTLRMYLNEEVDLKKIFCIYYLFLCGNAE